MQGKHILMHDMQQSSWYFCKDGDIKASLVASKTLSLGYLTSGAACLSYFSIALAKCHDQDNLLKKCLIGCRASESP